MKGFSFSLVTRSLIIVLLQTGLLAAQNEHPIAVHFCEIRNHQLEEAVTLPGSVIASRVSTIAAEMAGLVEEYPVQEGSRVSRGEVLTRLRQQGLSLELRAARAQLKEDETRYRLAEINLRRSKELFEKNVFSRQQLDDASYEYEALGNRLERIRAQIALLEDQLERSVVRAPFDGVIVRERTEVGEWLEAGGAVAELITAEGLEILVQVPQKHYGRLQLNTATTVSFDARPGVEFSARVSAIIPRADLQARTFPLKLVFQRQPRGLGVGMTARVQLPLGKSASATLVPKDAIVRQNGQDFIFLLNGDQTVERMPVTTGEGVGSWISVHEELEERARVIIQGNERLESGQRVVAQPRDYPFP